MTKGHEPCQLRADGMRVWEIDRIETACPKCGTEIEIKADCLTDEELWREQPVFCWCEDCGCEFEVVVNDDNR